MAILAENRLDTLVFPFAIITWKVLNKSVFSGLVRLDAVLLLGSIKAIFLLKNLKLIEIMDIDLKAVVKVFRLTAVDEIRRNETRFANLPIWDLPTPAEVVLCGPGWKRKGSGAARDGEKEK
jgi:hypothetical protein